MTSCGKDPLPLSSPIHWRLVNWVHGIDIIVMDSGFMVMDSDLAGTAKLSSFNQEGVLQQIIPLEVPPGGETNPIMMIQARIFPDF